MPTDARQAPHATDGSWTLPRALGVGTVVIGTLDALDAVVVFGIRSGATPVRIFQTIASGAIGPQAYAGGLAAAALGLLLHFVIALGIMSVFLAAARVMPLLRLRPWLVGPCYGVAVYFAMNLVVLPLSAIGPVRFTAFGLTNGLLIHAFGVGLPAALVASRVAWPRAPRPLSNVS